MNRPDIDSAGTYGDSVKGRTRLRADLVWPRRIARRGLGHNDRIGEVALSSDCRKRLDAERRGAFGKCYRGAPGGNSGVVERCPVGCRRQQATRLSAGKDRAHERAVVLRIYPGRLLEIGQ